MQLELDEKELKIISNALHKWETSLHSLLVANGAIDEDEVEETMQQASQLRERIQEARRQEVEG